jgi:hypothetical protein
MTALIVQSRYVSSCSGPARSSAPLKMRTSSTGFSIARLANLNSLRLRALFVLADIRDFMATP